MELKDVFGQNNDQQIIRSELWGITRPHVREFLIMCFSYFQIVAVWSAGQKKYVEAIVDYLFGDLRRPHVVFTYDDCEESDDGFLVKPLEKMISTVKGLDQYMSLYNTLAIDDRLSTFSPVNPYNGIVIPPYDPLFTISSLNQADERLKQLSRWFLRPDVIASTNVQLLDKSNIFTPNI
jgi:hypothetical protein